MSKKTFYALSHVALAAALVSASTLASASNCSAKYCFVDGVMKLSTTQNLESLEDLLGFSISTPAGSTSSVQIDVIGDQGYANHIVSSPVTRVNFSQPNRITAAWMDGSAVNFTRSTRNVSMKNFSIKLQSVPNVVSINSVLQGTDVPTFWNLNGGVTDYSHDDNDALSIITGNGRVATIPEADGFYHLRVTASSVGLIGIGLFSSSHKQPPYATEALNTF